MSSSTLPLWFHTTSVAACLSTSVYEAHMMCNDVKACFGLERFYIHFESENWAIGNTFEPLFQASRMCGCIGAAKT